MSNQSTPTIKAERLTMLAGFGFWSIGQEVSVVINSPAWTMKPNKILRIYLIASFVVGSLFSAAVAYMASVGEIETQAGAVLPLCWNVLFMLILPLVLDWSEQKYLKARFLEIEDLARENPELKAYLDKQCQRLHVETIKLAVVDSPVSEPFSYGLWRYNPRLIVPSSTLSAEDVTKAIPSIEVELSRFARQGVTLSFFTFTIVQTIVLYALQQIH
ncbi:MAG: hypothetical protein K2W95_16700 [Candidatus Obscuribacterales bacterium]|nr:hypothetical protein [Candidatus Obscuribacterales bacterium]